MKNRAFRAVAVAVSLLLMLAIPAQASPVQFNDVVQVVSGSQRNGGQSANVELRFIAQDDSATAGTTTNTPGSTSASGDTSSSGIVTSLQDPGGIVQTDVTEDIGVTECECGDFRVPVAGFPKWPFIPLVGLVCLVPDLCTKGKCKPQPGQDANCQPVTTPDCTTTGTCPGEVPEPASLLLFGSGIAVLGAGLRRRYAQAKNAQDQATTISGS